MPQEEPALDRTRIYRLDPRDHCRICPLDDLVLLYHVRSGQTHMVISPVPEMLEAMADGAPLSASDLYARLARDFADAAALRAQPAIATFLRWIDGKPPDFHAPTRTEGGRRRR